MYMIKLGRLAFALRRLPGIGLRGPFLETQVRAPEAGFASVL
jgi:hypothetical protein